MAGIVTRQIAIGEQQNVRVLSKDLNILKKIQQQNESLAVTFNRVMAQAAYHFEVDIEDN